MSAQYDNRPLGEQRELDDKGLTDDSEPVGEMCTCVPVKCKHVDGWMNEVIASANEVITAKKIFKSDTRKKKIGFAKVALKFVTKAKGTDLTSKGDNAELQAHLLGWWEEQREALDVFESKSFKTDRHRWLFQDSVDAYWELMHYMYRLGVSLGIPHHVLYIEGQPDDDVGSASPSVTNLQGVETVNTAATNPV